METYIQFDDSALKLDPFEFECAVRNARYNGGDKTWQTVDFQDIVWHSRRVVPGSDPGDLNDLLYSRFRWRELTVYNRPSATALAARLAEFADEFGFRPVASGEYRWEWEFPARVEFHFHAAAGTDLPAWRVESLTWRLKLVGCEYRTFSAEASLSCDKRVETAGFGWCKAETGRCLWRPDGKGEHDRFWRAIHVASGNARRRAQRVAWSSEHPNSHLISQLVSQSPARGMQLIPLAEQNLQDSNRPGVFGWKPRFAAWHILRRGEIPVPAGYYRIEKYLERSVIITLERVPGVITA